MSTQHVETLIIGAGQAGLSTGYFLAQQGVSFLIVDGRTGSATTGGSSGTPCASTPRPSTTGCPGCPSRLRIRGISRKEEVANYLEAYALHRDLPVPENTRIEWLVPGPGGGYVIGNDGVEHGQLRSVVIATRTFGRTPQIPAKPTISTRASSDAFQRVPAPIPTTAGTGPGGGRLALGRRCGLRDGADPLVRVGGRDAARSRLSSSMPRAGRAFLPFIYYCSNTCLTAAPRWAARRSTTCASTGAPACESRPASSPTAGWHGLSPGSSAAGMVGRCWMMAISSMPPMWSGARDSGRCSTGSNCRSSTPGGGRWSIAGWSGSAGPLLLGPSFQYGFSSMILPGRGPGCRLRRRLRSSPGYGLVSVEGLFDQLGAHAGASSRAHYRGRRIIVAVGGFGWA